MSIFNFLGGFCIFNALCDLFSRKEPDDSTDINDLNDIDDIEEELDDELDDY